VRKCLHCPHEGPEETFSHYKDKDGTRRPRNVCIECARLFSSIRQAKYKARHGDRVREAQRNRKYLKYHSDPEFRARCIEQSRKQDDPT
jgi:hypothetical protein